MLPPLGSILSYWQGVLQEKGISLSFGFSFDSDSFFVSGRVNMGRCFDPDDSDRYPQPLGADQYPWVDKEVLRHRPMTRQLGDLVLMDEETE